MYKLNIYKGIALLLVFIVAVYLISKNSEFSSERLRFTENEKLLYDISSVSTTKSLQNSTLGLSGDALFETQMNVKIFSVKSNSVTMGVEFDKINYKLNTQSVEDEYIEMYKIPFLLTLDKSGEISDILFSNTISAHDELFMRTIMSHFDLQLLINKKEWQNHHNNIHGEYLANYESIKENQFRKTILKYLSYKEALSIDVNESNTTFTSSKTHSWFDSIFVVEKDKMLLGTQTNQILAHQEIKIVYSNKNIDNTLKLFTFDSEDALRAFLNQTTKEQYTLQQKKENQQMKNAVNGSALNTSKLVEFFINGELNQYELQKKLIQYLTLYPDRTSELYDLMHSKSVNNMIAMTFISALVEVGHAQAQIVLTQVLLDGVIDQSVRQNAGIMIGFLKSPNDETINNLWKYYDDHDSTNDLLSSSLALALGNFGERNDDLYKKVSTRLKTELSKATDPNGIGVMLGSLGNTKNPDILDAVKPFTTNDEELVRKASIKAIGNVQGDESKVIKLIHTQMKDETSTEVLAQIGRSLEDKLLDDTVIESAASTLKYFNPKEASIDPSSMIKIVAKNAKSSQLLQEELRYMMAKDFNPRIKSEIIKGLSK